jgi:hypothetical protein
VECYCKKKFLGLRKMYAHSNECASYESLVLCHQINPQDPREKYRSNYLRNEKRLAAEREREAEKKRQEAEKRKQFGIQKKRREKLQSFINIKASPKTKKVP